LPEPPGNLSDSRHVLELFGYDPKHSSVHMIYLDNKARTKMKKGLAVFYKVPARPKLGAAIPIKPSKVHIWRITRTAY